MYLPLGRDINGQQNTCGDQRTTSMKQLSPSASSLLGMGFRLLCLAASAFTHLSHLASPLMFISVKKSYLLLFAYVRVCYNTYMYTGLHMWEYMLVCVCDTGCLP